MSREVASSDPAAVEEAEQVEQADVEPDEQGARWWAVARRVVAWSLLVATAGGAGWFLGRELSASPLQARVFSDVARQIDYRVDDGPSDAIRFPETGPYNERLGYAELPEITERLGARGFELTHQARSSERALELSERGLFFPYDAALQSGLEIADGRGNVVHGSLYPTRVYDDFEAIPPLVVDALLHIENRALLDPSRPTFNPALEWRRFALAVGEVGYAELGGEIDPDGASTLATQIEKYRHSPGGRTRDYEDKIRQMLSASLRAYKDGEQTLEAQKDVVLTYVNSVPLSAVPGFGEVRGIGDGLFAWYGADFERASQALRAPFDTVERARAFRQVLSLFVAQRRPSYYLVDPKGRARLDEMTDFYLRDLARHGLISAELRDLALAAPTGPWRNYVADEGEPFWLRKHAHSLRVDLLELTGAPSLYALERYDVDVATTLNQDVQHAVATTLRRLADPAFVVENGLDRWRLLDKGDPSKVIYSFTLYERTPEANVLRVQADTFDQPFNINEGMKLNLGSTAKLRTLASYLNVVATLHEELAGLSDEELDALEVHWSDRLTRWAIDFLEEREGEERSLQAMLDAAMLRRYSADPRERFFTGGGVHRFSNFNYKYDRSSPTVRLAIEQSINLVFVRMMREIVRFYMFRQEGLDAQILRDRSDPRRRAYLERFADYEGKVFLADFFRRYEEDTPQQSIVRFLKGRKWSPKKFVTAYRAVRPDTDVYSLRNIMQSEMGRTFDLDLVREMYEAYGPEKFGLNDQGYLSGVHPLELWLLRWKRDHPEAGWDEAVEASNELRQTVYEWLFETSRKHAQDLRIRVMMEQDAFGPIYEEWRRLGYPFGELVPSYATSIGSSSDRPDALAELVGIILNDGVRKPEVRFESLHFARGTPYETRFERVPEASEQVMQPEVARTLRRALAGVVEDGTASRLNDYSFEVDGRPVTLGGKTGTGDNRHKVTNRYGTVIKSIARNRTATFVFYLGERFFGTITAYVPGEQADEYHFTSGLAVSVLGILGPTLEPLWDDGAGDAGLAEVGAATPHCATCRRSSQRSR